MPLFESKDINELQTLLNSKEYTPPRAYRRNVRVYTLVCYVNNITGCYLSKNAEPIPLFIERAKQHMQNFLPNDNEKLFYQIVSNYLNLVETHLYTQG